MGFARRMGPGARWRARWVVNSTNCHSAAKELQNDKIDVILLAQRPLGTKKLKKAGAQRQDHGLLNFLGLIVVQ